MIVINAVGSSLTAISPTAILDASAFNALVAFVLIVVVVVICNSNSNNNYNYNCDCNTSGTF